jgi:RNA polymerase sigma-70 factor (ECF subfamily)
MLDSPRLTPASIAVRRDPQTVEDLRSTTVPDDPVQRRDLILIERARSGDLDAFNDLVTLYQDALFALVVRMVPDRDQAADAVQEAFFSAYRNLGSFRGGSVKSWLNRICVNAAMDTQRARKRRPVQP